MIQRNFVKGDRLTALYAQLLDGAGAVIDLLGQSVVFYMVSTVSDVVKVNGKAANIEDSTTGKVSYSWDAEDIDTEGTYWGWFIRVKDGKTGTHPIGEKLLITIVDGPAV
jgi:hypothetical protein